MSSIKMQPLVTSTVHITIASYTVTVTYGYKKQGQYNYQHTPLCNEV